MIGLDGFDPGIAEPMLHDGRLPHLAALRGRGGYSRLQTTNPAQTPVAWSSFATGVNPGGHGIFDFLRRDLDTYLPDLALNRYEQSNPLLPAKVVNLRRGTPLWSVLASAGIPATVIRCPCTYPPDKVKGRLLAGMGVPDIRGGLGTSTLYTTAPDVRVSDNEQVIELQVVPGTKGRFDTHVIGPRNPRTRGDVTAPISISVDEVRRGIRIECGGRPRVLELEPGRWSQWLRLNFRRGPLQGTAGMVRFLLVRIEPHLELYASPVNFDPAAPPFPISHPWDYGAELARHLGPYYTAGIAEDHTGLSNERFDEAAFLDQCEVVMREREAMLELELKRFDEGLLFCLFDTPDRIQHMFWRFGGREGGSGRRRLRAGSAAGSEFDTVIEDHYRRCDELVGRVQSRVDSSTVVIVLSDHGFTSFERGLHLNAWLAANGYLFLQPGVDAGEAAGEFFRHVDWGRTRAYALGLGGIYLNQRGREAEGIVDASESDEVAAQIAGGLSGLVDPVTSTVAVPRVRTRAQLYSGPCAAESPDLVVDTAAGYRVSWTTAVGGVPATLFEDNTRKWSGDHIVDPALVPGVLFMSVPYRRGNPTLLDLAPTILGVLGAPVPPAYEGSDLLSDT